MYGVEAINHESYRARACLACVHRGPCMLHTRRGWCEIQRIAGEWMSIGGDGDGSGNTRKTDSKQIRRIYKHTYWMGGNMFRTCVYVCVCLLHAVRDDDDDGGEMRVTLVCFNICLMLSQWIGKWYVVSGVYVTCVYGCVCVQAARSASSRWHIWCICVCIVDPGLMVCC